MALTDWLAGLGGKILGGADVAASRAMPWARSMAGSAPVQAALGGGRTGTAILGGLGAGIGGAAQAGLIPGLSELFDWPRHNLVEPLLKTLGLPGTGGELARVLSGIPETTPMDYGPLDQPDSLNKPYRDILAAAAGPYTGMAMSGPSQRNMGALTPATREEPGFLAKSLGMLYDAATDPWTWGGMALGAGMPKIGSWLGRGGAAGLAEAGENMLGGAAKTVGKGMGVMGSMPEQAAEQALTEAGILRKAEQAKRLTGSEMAAREYAGGRLGGEGIVPSRAVEEADVPGFIQARKEFGLKGPPDPLAGTRTLTPQWTQRSKLADLLGLSPGEGPQAPGLQSLISETTPTAPAGPPPIPNLPQIGEKNLFDVMESPGKTISRARPGAANMLQQMMPEQVTGGGLQLPPGVSQRDLPTIARGGTQFSPMEVLQRLKEIAAQQPDIDPAMIQMYEKFMRDVPQAGTGPAGVQQLLARLYGLGRGG